MEFGAESAVAVKEPDPKSSKISTPPRFRRFRPTQIAAVALLVGALGAAVYWANRLQVPAAPQSGTLRIETDSPGAEVRVDGTLKGTTPLMLTMPTGKHLVVVQSGERLNELSSLLPAFYPNFNPPLWPDNLIRPEGYRIRRDKLRSRQAGG